MWVAAVWISGVVEVVAFGYAEGCVVFAEDWVDFFGEEGFVAELEGYGGCVVCAEGGEREEFGEECGVGFEVGRELEEEQAEAAGFADEGE